MPMPICRSTLGAFSRTRVPNSSYTSNSLVPFLYQTATIQQRNHTSRPIARRNLSTRSKSDIDVPFEDADSLPPTIETAVSSRKTTITGPERAAFQKLYNKFSHAEMPQDEIPFAHEVDQIADEWYEEDDDKDSTPDTLDALFDAVLAGSPAPGKISKSKTNRPMKSLQTLAEEILKPEVEAAKKKPKEEAEAEAARIRSIRDEERIRVELLLESAQTDRELWEILDREVFGMMRKLDLDGPKKKPNKPKPSDDLRYDPRILFPNFPSHIVFATRLFRSNFPASPLPLSILPTMKSLGRSSYALGATTSLYNLIIRTVWVQHLSYDYIVELLTDMDNGGIAFDLGTLGILNAIVGEYADARTGRLGHPSQCIWRMEQVRESSQKLFRWREAVMQRLHAWTEKCATDGTLVRRLAVDQRSPRGPDDGIGFEIGGQKKSTYTRKHLPQRKPTFDSKAAVSAPAWNTSEWQKAKQVQQRSGMKSTENSETGAQKQQSERKEIGSIVS